MFVANCVILFRGSVKLVGLKYLLILPTWVYLNNNIDLGRARQLLC